MIGTRLCTLPRMGHFDHCIWDRPEFRSFLWLTAMKKMTGHREFGYLDAFHTIVIQDKMFPKEGMQNQTDPSYLDRVAK